MAGFKKNKKSVSHEYEDDAIEMTNIINLIYAKKGVIESIYLTIKAQCYEIIQSS